MGTKNKQKSVVEQIQSLADLAHACHGGTLLNAEELPLEHDAPPEAVSISTALLYYGSFKFVEGKIAPQFYIVKKLIATLGSYSVNDISPELCTFYQQKRTGLKSHLGRAVSSTTAYRDLAVLKAALNCMKRCEYLRYVPPIKILTSAVQVRTELRQREVTAIENVRGRFSPHITILILLAAYTGQRPRTLLSLKWDHVDRSGGVIHFHPLGKSKTNKRARDYKITDEVQSVLENAKLHRESNYVVSWRGRPVKAVTGKTISSVFETAAVVQENMLEFTESETERAEIRETVKRLRSSGLYNFRSSVVTKMARQGSTVEEIGQVTGQDQVRTIDRYTAFNTGDYESLSKVLSKIFNVEALSEEFNFAAASK